MSFRARVARLFQPRVRTLFGEQSYAGLIINPLKVAAFVHLFLEYFYTPKGTYGPSMLPTINLRDDWVIISRLYSRGKGIEVGDVISLLHPMVPGEAAVKRVLGMPGDFVLRDTPGKGQDLMLQVPEGHCWVIGDNMESSRDSRIYGPQPLGLIRGKVLVKFKLELGWPWQWRLHVKQMKSPLGPPSS